MSKLSHSGNADMDAIERQGRFLDEQEAKQAAYAAKMKARRAELETHDYRKEGDE
jgi:hypothetical protein